MNKNYLFFRNFDNLLREKGDSVNFNTEIDKLLKPMPVSKLMGPITCDEPYSYKIAGQGLMVGTNLINYSAIKLDQRSKNSTEQENKFFQNTLNFDYTLGEVIIPGSGVKGALRSTLKLGLEELNTVLEQIGLTSEKLDNLLFENDNTNHYVIYFDATIEGVTIDDQVYMYSKENITPMENEPNPLNFIKVIPTCTINFNIHIPQKVDEQLNNRGNEIIDILIANSEFGAKGNTGFGSVVKIYE